MYDPRVDLPAISQVGYRLTSFLLLCRETPTSTPTPTPIHTHIFSLGLSPILRDYYDSQNNLGCYLYIGQNYYDERLNKLKIFI